MSVVIAITAGVLFGTGTYLLLQKLLTRIIVGLGLIAHARQSRAARFGRQPRPAAHHRRIRRGPPLPTRSSRHWCLTAIVITFGVTAFLLALAYRSWDERGSDEVEDDVEDRRIAAPPLRGRSSDDVARHAGDRIAAPRRRRGPGRTTQPDAPACGGAGGIGDARRRVGLAPVAVDSSGPIVLVLGGWSAPFGITLVADRLAVLLLFTASVALLAVLAYAVEPAVVG